MPGNFVHLHVHSEYSLLDGANRISKLVSRVKELGMDSVAITDHGVMYGVIDFYIEAHKNNVKPIIGCEVYVAPGSRFDKENSKEARYYHLTLLAENNEGYHNLVKIVSLGYLEGFYFKPRVDKELLRQYSRGIIALSGCIGGEVPTLVLNGNYEGALKAAREYREIFGEGNFYLELQINGIEEQTLANQGLIKISRETGIPLVATNDCHYLKKEDARTQEVLMCIQTGKRMSDEDRMIFETDEFYVKSPEEMMEKFKAFPEAIENTVKIADRCNVTIEFGKPILPEFKTPDDMDSFEYLRQLCYEGMEKRYGSPAPAHVRERLDYELGVIRQMGYVDYYLIVWDFIKYARDNNIMVGPGRGSGAGSLAAYCLGITNIDSLKYNLIFERFLNPERVSMPDFDVDFCYERRGEVIDYVVRKYGADKVAQIITFGTMQARAAIKDVGRALDIPFNEVDQIAKMIPNAPGSHISIKYALEANRDLKERYENDARIKEMIDTAIQLEGMPRHSSTHAAGVVISRNPIIEHVPVQKTDDNVVTQFTMGILDQLGLLKVDFLGLRTLTVIRDTIDLIEANHGIRIDLDKLTYDDPNVYKMISEGKTAGVFQMESAGMTQFMMELAPSNLEDVIAGIALFRPGPMDQIPTYLENKRNPDKIKYLCPQLEHILNVTYGCIVYQEQVMQIVRDLAGYSYGRSDLVRRAMAKKKPEVMMQERENFINGIVDENGQVIVRGAVRNGITVEVANRIFDQMMDFASYAFNKSHAAAYAVVGYQTAWLKYYYPVEYMAALMNSFLTNPGKISEYVVECRNLNIKVLPPDINESDVKFSVHNGQIRFGLTAVKNAGLQAVESIIEERRKNGPYKSFMDFCQRINSHAVNKRCVESFIKAGAFDSLGIYRSRLLAVYEKTMDSVAAEKKKTAEGQLSFFSMQDFGVEQVEEEVILPDIPEYEPRVLLAMEKLMLGLYISGHPLQEYEDKLKLIRNIVSTDINSGDPEDGDSGSMDNTNPALVDSMAVTTGGIVAGKSEKMTKNGARMAFVTLEDMYGTMELIVFPNVYEKYSSLLFEDSIIVVSGRLSITADEKPKIICETVSPISVLDSVDTGHLRIRANNPEKTGQPKDEVMRKIIIRPDIKPESRKAILALLEFFSGDKKIDVVIENDGNGADKVLHYNVFLNEKIIKRLKDLAGSDNVTA